MHQLQVLYCLTGLLVCIGVTRADVKDAFANISVHHKAALDLHSHRGLTIYLNRATASLTYFRRPEEGPGVHSNNVTRERTILSPRTGALNHLNRFRSLPSQTSRESEFYEHGDPDSTTRMTNKRFARMHSGNVGFFRLDTPAWYRPCATRASSFIVLAPDIILLDSHFTKHRNGDFKTGVPYRLDYYYEPDADLNDEFRRLKTHDYPKHRIQLVARLASGFYMFRITSQVKYSSYIKWEIMVGDNGMYDEPYRGCFAFKYTHFQFGRSKIHLIKTEIPIRVAHYDPDDKYYYADSGPRSYAPHSGLDGEYNNGSPVFCGLEGKLKFFARMSPPSTKHNYTLQLIPTHLIADQISCPHVGME